MILYFSGTGNSEYAARRIGKEIPDQTLNLFERIRNRDYSPLSSERPWVVAAPTYAWRIPRLVQEWLERTELIGSRDIYFVLTCGGGIGNAGHYADKLCAAKNLRSLGCLGVIMPENYIALYAAPEREEALRIIGRAQGKLDEAARLIRENKPFPQPETTLQDRLISGIVNDFFYPVMVHAAKFCATEACISCGKCATVCPLGNIRLERGKPAWGKDCTHCMACINRCPKEAIEYGSHTKGAARYVFPQELEIP